MQLQPVYRIVVFVPPAHLDAPTRGILAVDDLAAGGYEHGMWESALGFEPYRALAATMPVQSRAGEQVRELTVQPEFCIPRDPQRLQRLLAEGVAARHPWKVPAVFVDETVFAAL